MALSFLYFLRYSTEPVIDVEDAVKLHALLDYEGFLPVFAQITEGNLHEVKIAQSMVFPKGSMIVAMYITDG